MIDRFVAYLEGEGNKVFDFESINFDRLSEANFISSLLKYIKGIIENEELSITEAVKIIYRQMHHLCISLQIKYCNIEEADSYHLYVEKVIAKWDAIVLDVFTRNVERKTIDGKITIVEKGECKCQK